MQQTVAGKEDDDLKKMGKDQRVGVFPWCADKGAMVLDHL